MIDLERGPVRWWALRAGEGCRGTRVASDARAAVVAWGELQPQGYFVGVSPACRSPMVAKAPAAAGRDDEHRGVSHPQGVQQRAHLCFGFGQLSVGVRIRHDAGPREEPQARGRDQPAAQGNRELAVASRIHPADRP